MKSRIQTMRCLKKVLSVSIVEQATGQPCETWPGNCYGVASALHRSGVASALHRSGVVANSLLSYGHWHGRIARGSLFAGRPIVRHGWIEVQASDGLVVVDPTRYVFENAEPYIWVGKKTAEYDAGGQVLRHLMNDARPFPPRDEGDLLIKFTRKETEIMAKIAAVEDSEVGDGLTDVQCRWAANLSLERLGKFAIVLYKKLKRAHRGALIPLDNERIVFGK